MLNPETWGYSARESILVVIFHALGPYVVLLPIASLVSFYLTLKVLRRGRGPQAVSTLLLIIPAPFLVGLFGGCHGILNSFTTFAPPGALQFQEIFYGLGIAMFPPAIGLLLTMPAYAFAIAGTFTQSLFGERPAAVDAGSATKTCR